jgi:3-phosphoshikimate 1-carboxyvinyltransferase
MEFERLERALQFSGNIKPPGSKSIANRVLPLAALTTHNAAFSGTTQVWNLPDGEDVLLMQGALKALGYTIEDIPGSRSTPGISVTAPQASAFPPQKSTDLFLGNSGTATRILTALLAAGDGTFRITGIPRMYERPIGDLVDALRPLCGETKILYEGEEGFPPLKLEARGLAGGITRIRGNLSSQFVTGLLMAMPLCRGRVEVEIEGTLVSAPYVDLTLKVMRDFGAVVERDGYRRFWIDKPMGYVSPGSFSVEPDASSASYFLAAAAIAHGTVFVMGVGKDSAQGEAGFASKLKKMGAQVAYQPEGIRVSNAEANALNGIDADLDLMSDTGMTLAVVALFAEGKTTIRNVGNWRLKETDRLHAMATELRKLGATVEEGPDWISIDPPAALTPDVEIDTYDDHRMAMCFSLVCLGPKGVPVTIKDPGCVRKTYPGYWDAFKRMAGL